MVNGRFLKRRQRRIMYKPRDVWGKACAGWLGDYPYKVLDVATSILSCPYLRPTLSAVESCSRQTPYLSGSELPTAVMAKAHKACLPDPDL